MLAAGKEINPHDQNRRIIKIIINHLNYKNNHILVSQRYFQAHGLFIHL